MSRTRRSVPVTSNPVAAKLIASAQAQCKGCRDGWRLTGWSHCDEGKTECTAKEQRAELRAIAARSATMRRMWVNQPSTLQPLYKLHGQNVLAAPERDGIFRIYFLSGDVVSMEAPSNTLSGGWNKHS